MRSAVALMVATLLVGAATGEWAYNRFGDNWSYETQAGSTISGQLSQPGYTDTANKFVSAATGAISDIYVPVALDMGPNTFEVWIMADNNNMPGTILQSWTVTDQAFPFDGHYHDPIHLTVDGPELQAGAAYWITLHAGDPHSWLVWMFTKPWVFETVAQRFAPDQDVWNIIDPGFTSAYAIAVVPEPATIGLLGLALLVTRRR